jgi:hypothetical protein
MIGILLLFIFRGQYCEVFTADIQTNLDFVAPTSEFYHGGHVITLQRSF